MGSEMEGETNIDGVERMLLAVKQMGDDNQ